MPRCRTASKLADAASLSPEHFNRSPTVSLSAFLTIVVVLICILSYRCLDRLASSAWATFKARVTALTSGTFEASIACFSIRGAMLVSGQFPCHRFDDLGMGVEYHLETCAVSPNLSKDTNRRS
ncbi:hypothetical protein SISSUDRAFT_433972 [Sistotremastrum suecicum HHB10207 ss-3]|uniref:Uncharacterized protein n=1 Tax=Sistotremastrum suecicum HHB10207 ss-3 TaxID=1314776 RepID=A0A165YGC2_9AGAM|nr:hypothetical protein SISSUDRAFT_433972 [Sistotremastrum suecicum HHB10207 ss-3]